MILLSLEENEKLARACPLPVITVAGNLLHPDYSIPFGVTLSVLPEHNTLGWFWTSAQLKKATYQVILAMIKYVPVQIL